MAGRIRDDDIAEVRSRTNIAEVIGEYTQLRSAGGGSLKGLCPFHDERSPSFHVTPSRGFYHCFGCGEGGDVLTFLQKVDHLSFTEAVERLAARAGLELRYVEGPAPDNRERGLRARLVEANRAAAAFYTAQLQSPEAQIGRRFLEARGFDRDAAERFGVGYAPQGWNGLTDHLRAAGFTDQELLGAGLVVEGKRGVYDRFRGRLTWAIRDIGGDTVGFGARRLYDTDEGPKYLNTPETSVYKKSQVLYGIEFAKRAIAKQQQAVVVEGYTDVMACHLSGVETAVATCGTAFGEEHIKVLRRLLMDDSAFTGQVVFTFDGDAAGQKAALRAFDDEQKFVAQTFVAVEPGGLDPCELRQQKGPEAVRGLVEARLPLVEFAIRSAVRSHDLDHAEGRIAALRAGAPLVARIKDRSLRPEYARLLAGWIGMEAPPVLAAVSAAERRGPQAATTRERAPAPVNPTATEGAADAAAAEPVEPPTPRPNPREPRLAVEREALKLAMQHPDLVGDRLDEVDAGAFWHPAYVALARAVAGAGGCANAPSGSVWVEAVRGAADSDVVRSLAAELAVEPLLVAGAPTTRYAAEQVAGVEEREVERRIADLRSRLQRTDAGDAEAQTAVLAEIVELEQRRRALREQLAG
jgi:DNA primase